MTKKAKPASVPEDFDPQPTVFAGGVDRMIQVFEALRDASPAGYTGGSIVASIKGWGVPNNGGTSCSPFTATVLGILYDPSGATDTGRTHEPVYQVNADRQDPLPVDFYLLHQGVKRGDAVMKRIKNAGRGSGFGTAESVVAFNLGFAIDPKDMRRGDLVAIDWSHGGGHATFCWDVHLDANGDVDAFQFVSANGALKPQPHGVGISVGTGASKVPLFITHNADGTYQKTAKMTPLFQDREEYVQHSTWYCLKGVKKGDVDKSTFRVKPSAVLEGQLAQLAVVRLFGFKPPGDASHPRHKDSWDVAAKVAQWDPPAPYAMGGAAQEQKPAPTISGVKPAKVETKKADDPKPADGADSASSDAPASDAPPPQKVEQKKEAVHGHQYDVELKIKRLYDAKWLDVDPGEPDEVNDDQSRAAIKAFQQKYGQDDGLSVDGIAGPKTRPVIDRIVGLLESGKPDPKGDGRDQPAPKLLFAYWLANLVEPGGTAQLKLEGLGLDKLSGVDVSLTDNGGHTQGACFDAGPAKNGGAIPVPLAPDFAAGAFVTGTLTAHFDGADDQTREISIVLCVAAKSDSAAASSPATTAPDNLLPWDESKWPKRMRDILAELRATEKPSGADLDTWSLTQYGVKTKLKAGDTPVLSDDGTELGRIAVESLAKADIEGTMMLNGRMLNISSSHGWSYDPVTHKPVKGSFKPEKSRWLDVTDTKPFGSGSRLPLIPFRVLAVNPYRHKNAYLQKVYIKQLDGLVMPTGETHNGVVVVGDCGGMVDHHFDFFVANEDHHLRIPKVGEKDGRQQVELTFLGPCAAAKKK